AELRQLYAERAPGSGTSARFASRGLKTSDRMAAPALQSRSSEEDEAMRIVIATDFSPCSEAATRLGVALARRQQAALVLVYAVEPRVADVPLVPIGVTG